ncbi:MAG: GNAT family N-acetyltransferase [Crocinitomicaceae bacterium]|nr:GNAT family N-acetyltransferase [Crocinitomicaceae bacterium]MBK8924638.1 GNAT family N-acetyltransferase [Crocinitomicaceae bacterium]
MKIRKAKISDREEIAALYRSVADSVVGIARRPHEITDTYVYALLNTKPSDIVCLVALDESDQIIALAHGIKNGLEIHSHILSDLTVIVKTDQQSKGVGKQLAQALLQHIANERPDIMRLEMEVPVIPSLIDTFLKGGFHKEGQTIKRIKRPNGTFSDSVLMVWFNPNFKG